MEVIKGNFCSLLPVKIEDAKLIVNLRTSRPDFLKKNILTIESQINYLTKYESRYQSHDEIYFKIFDNRIKKDSGVTRITNLKSINTFGFESGVMYENAGPNLYLDAYFMCLRIGFVYFARTLSDPWIVDKKNKRMLEIHKKIGIAEVVDEDKEYVYLLAYQNLFLEKFESFKKLGFGKLGGIYEF